MAENIFFSFGVGFFILFWTTLGIIVYKTASSKIKEWEEESGAVCTIVCAVSLLFCMFATGIHYKITSPASDDVESKLEQWRTRANNIRYNYQLLAQEASTAEHEKAVLMEGAEALKTYYATCPQPPSESKETP